MVTLEKIMTQQKKIPLPGSFDQKWVGEKRVFGCASLLSLNV